MGEVRLTAPIHPGELPRAMERGLADIAARVSARAVVEGRGHDLLLRIYMAGLYHGAELAGRAALKEGQEG